MVGRETGDTHQGGDLVSRAHGGLRWLEWRHAGVVAAFPLRAGGVSESPYATLNLGLNVGDEPRKVLENRRLLCAALGLDPERLIVPDQVHGTSWTWVGEPEAGRGALAQDACLEGRDALLTAAPALGLAISHADCVPVIVVALGDGGPLFAMIHAGWRGMLAGIVGQVAGELARHGRLCAAVVGPSIGACCFAVDDSLRRRFEERFPGCGRPGHVDLWHCARADLEAAGVPPAAVTVAGICTVDDGRFFSHRREAGLTGRHLAIAWRLRQGGPRPQS